MSDGVRPLVLAPHEVRAALRGPVLIVRAVNPQPASVEWFEHQRGWCAKVADKKPGQADYEMLPCPLGTPGTRLWIREAWGYRGSVWSMLEPLQQHHVQYRADGAERAIDRPKHDRSGLPRTRPEREGESEGSYQDYLAAYWAAWRSPVTMPRWASRLTVEVESVEVRRVSTITTREALDAGALDATELDYIGSMTCDDARLAFGWVWDSQAGGRETDDPWAWFARVRACVPPSARDALGEQLDGRVGATRGGGR